VIVVVSVLLVTVPCVLKERQNHSLELLMASDVNLMEFLFAKLLARVVVVMTVIGSSCPLTGLVFYVGGVSVRHLFYLMIQLTIVCFYLGAIGILCSSCCKKTVTAAVWSVFLTFLVILGSLMMVSGWYVLKKTTMGAELKNMNVYVSVSRLSIILLLNPLYSYLRMINDQLGNLKDIFSYADFHRGTAQKLIYNWVIISSAVQVAFGFWMIWFSAWKMNHRNRYKKTI